MLQPYASEMPSSSNQPSAAPTVVVARRVLPDSQEEFRAWDWRIRSMAASYPGYLGSEVQPPNTSHPGEWVTVYSFATADELDKGETEVFARDWTHEFGYREQAP